MLGASEELWREKIESAGRRNMALARIRFEEGKWVVLGPRKVRFSYRRRIKDCSKLIAYLARCAEQAQRTCSTNDDALKITAIGSNKLSNYKKDRNASVQYATVLQHMDAAGIPPNQVPHLPNESRRKLERVLEELRWVPDVERHQAFLQHCYVPQSPELLLATFRYDATIESLYDWVRLDNNIRDDCIHAAMRMNRGRFDAMLTGDHDVAHEHHLSLHFELIPPRYREAIRTPLKLTISTPEYYRTQRDQKEMAHREFDSHDKLILAHGSWCDPARLAEARAFIEKRHKERSAAIRSVMARNNLDFTTRG